MPEPPFVGTNHEDIISKYYAEETVMTIVTIKVETKDVDRIAHEISRLERIEDVYLVTGDTDIIVKARFESYNELKEFLVQNIASIEGIKDTKTLMVISVYKEKGIITEK